MPTSEILPPVSHSDAVEMASIHAMRQISDAISTQSKMFSDNMAAQMKVAEAQTAAIEKLSGQVADVDRRLIRVEEAKHGRDIERLTTAFTTLDNNLSTRLNKLESVHDQQRGAKALVDWMRSTMPWLVAVGAAVLATARVMSGGSAS